MSLGAYRHAVVFQNPGPPVPDGDGGYTQTWTAVPPGRWFVSVEPAQTQDLERAAPGTVISLATYTVRGRFHPDVTTQSRMLLARAGTVTTASHYADRVVADGASHYWRLGEGSGTVALDMIGGSTGTISGGVMLAQPGALADGTTAMTFNGTTGKIVTPAAAVQTPCTIEAWIKTANAVAALPIWSTPYTGAQEEWNFRVEGGLLAIQVMTAGQTQQSTISVPTANYADGLWYHAVATVQSNVLALYVDGVLKQTGVPAFTVGGMTLAMELGYQSDGDHYWLGTLDDVAIYPRALTAAEIAAHYAAAQPPSSPPRTFAITGTADPEARGITMELTAVEVVA